MWTITRLRLKRDRRGVSNIIVVVLSLVIIVAIIANIVLWSYEMNQLDWEKMKEDMRITKVERVNRSSWFVAQSEYTVNTGSQVSGSYTDTHSADVSYETFRESTSTSSLHEKLLPNVAGQYAEWGTVYPGGTAHWDACDEDPPDDDASYVQTSTNQLRSEGYNLQDSSGSGTINWIEVYVRARKTGAASRSIRTLVRTHDTKYESSDISLTTSYQSLYTEYSTNPFTGQAWTWSEIDSLQAGASAASSGNTHVRMSAVWVFVNYTSTNYMFGMNGTFTLDFSTYPRDCIQTVEIQLRYIANDTGEKWYLKAYNWSSSSYSDSGFNVTTGHTPTMGWDSYAVNLTDEWRSYVQDNGTIYVEFLDEGVDSDQTAVDIDFLGVRTEIDGTRLTFENEGALTSHLVSLWIINSTNHQRYDINVFANSAETTTYTRADISLPTGQYTVKVITERGNTAVYSGT